MRIVVDPGHGGTDPGAVNGELGLRESLIVMDYGRELTKFLSEKGHRVILTRFGDYFVSLPERVRIAKDERAKLFLSLHANSAENPTATGFEVWTSVGNTKADDYASAIFSRISATFPSLAPRADWSDGDADKEKNYYVLKETPIPAVLVELGFICNRAEALWMADLSTVRKYAYAIAQAVG